MASFGWCCDLIGQKQVSFTVLLSWLGLAGFNRLRISVRIRVRYSFSDRVGTRRPDVE